MSGEIGGIQYVLVVTDMMKCEILLKPCLVDVFDTFFLSHDCRYSQCFLLSCRRASSQHSAHTTENLLPFLPSSTFTKAINHKSFNGQAFKLNI
jgi:hypothetical protein